MSVNHDARVFNLETKAAAALWRGLDTPVALSCYLLAKAEEWDQLISKTVDPMHYCSGFGVDFAADYQAVELLKKNPRVPLKVDRAAVALDKWRVAEARCKETNERLSKDPIPGSSEVRETLHRAREFIRAVLGSVVTGPDEARRSAVLERVQELVRFGPGSTTSVSGVVTQGRKYSPRVLDATPRCREFFRHMLSPHWGGAETPFRSVTASKLTTVPKNAKTDRVICVEPDLNIFVQLGLGAYLRGRLGKFGVDLRSQEVNRYLASKAHEYDLCTMDLSSASDLISREAVWLLLPDDWAHLLWLARVDETRLPSGETVVLEKWSSMGNGYTFELETLIFYSVIWAAAEVQGLDKVCVNAYGDDLIFYSSMRPLVEAALDFLGFKVNTEKTFGQGLFYESCGTDWFDGVNVRPVFFRSTHVDFETICYTYANALSTRAIAGTVRDSRYLPAWTCCFTAVHPDHRHPIPLGYGDCGFQQPFDRARPSVRRLRDGWCGWEFRVRTVDMKVTSEFQLGIYLARLHGSRYDDVTIGVSPSGAEYIAEESLRGQYCRAQTRRSRSSYDWPHLGPWV